MATARETIKKALGLLAVLQSGEEPEATEAADALSTLNEMLTSWGIEGITLNHTTLLLTDTLPFPPSHTKAIQYGLAVELAPYYGKEVSALVYQQANTGFAELLSLYGKQDQSLDTYGPSY